MKDSLRSKSSTTTSSNARPFFDKDGEGSFFSDKKKSEKPFFNPSPIQAKLTTGQSNDEFEKEADFMAEEVVQPLKKTKTPLKIQTKSISQNSHSNPDLEDQLQHSKGRGEALPENERNKMETAFSADFSQVKIHTDAKSVQMNQDLGANAFTHDSDIYFNKGMYNPNSNDGQKLLAHELTHTIQQGAVQNSPTIQKQDESEGEEPHGTQIPTAISTIPGYTQNYQECGAASLVTALVVWDEMRRDQDPDGSSDQVSLACSIILDHMENQRDVLIQKWNGRTIRNRAGVSGIDVFTYFRNRLILIRTGAMQPGAFISERDYNSIGIALYFLWDENGTLGLSNNQIRGIRDLLHLDTSTSSYPLRFSEFFSSSVLQNLNPQQIAQIIWFVVTNNQRGSTPLRQSITLGGHAFLIGRYGDGGWFLTDQGTSPAGTDQSETIEAPTLQDLETEIRYAAQSGDYWIWTGHVPSNVDTQNVMPEITLLNRSSSTELRERRQELANRQTSIQRNRTRYTYLRNLALTGSDFRVRVQALLHLSRMLNDELIRPSDYRPILRQSLADDHRAVKVLAGERIGFHRFSSLEDILRFTISDLRGEQDSDNDRAIRIMERALSRL